MADVAGAMGHLLHQPLLFSTLAGGDALWHGSNDRVAGAMPLVTTRVAILLFLVIAGIVAVDLTFMEGRGSIVAARHFVDLIDALAFWR